MAGAVSARACVECGTTNAVKGDVCQWCGAHQHRPGRSCRACGTYTLTAAGERAEAAMEAEMEMAEWRREDAYIDEYLAL